MLIPKWMEAHTLPSFTAKATIDHLQLTCSIFGLPGAVMSDNGTQFTGAVFQKFIEGESIQHIISAPYHSSFKWSSGESCANPKRGNEEDGTW